MESKFFETRDEVAQVLRDFQPLFSYFVGEVCGKCRKTANVPPATGWFCRCGSYNMQDYGGHGMMPHEAPDYGPPAQLIQEVGREVNTLHVVGFFGSDDPLFLVFADEEEARQAAESTFDTAAVPGNRLVLRNPDPFWFAVCDQYIRRLWRDERYKELVKIIRGENYKMTAA